MYVNPDQIPIPKCLLISNKIEGMKIKLGAVKTAFKDTYINGKIIRYRIINTVTKLVPSELNKKIL